MLGSKMAVFTPRKRRGFFLTSPSSSSSSSKFFSSKFSSSLSDIPTSSEILRVGGSSCGWDWRDYFFRRRGGQTYWVQEAESGRGTMECDAKENDKRNQGVINYCNGIQHVGRRDVAGMENCNHIRRRDNACSELVAKRGDCRGFHGRGDVAERYNLKGTRRRHKEEGDMIARRGDCNVIQGNHDAGNEMIAKRGNCNNIRRRELARNEGPVERRDVICNEIRDKVDVAGSDTVAKRLTSDRHDTRERIDRITERHVWNKRTDNDYNGIMVEEEKGEMKDVTWSEGMKEGRYRFYQVVEEDEEGEDKGSREDGGGGDGEKEIEEEGREKGGKKREGNVDKVVERRTKEGEGRERFKEGNSIRNFTQSDSQVRDRSRVGVRSSLPFSVAPSSSSFASSGHSSGSSDTQSQGSGGGDSKESDSPTPEGSRKNAAVELTSSSSSSSSSSGVGVSVRCGKGHELPVTVGARESAALRQEVETLRAEITKARQTILHMQEREKKLKERLGDRVSRGAERGSGRVENLSLGERRPSALVRRYGNLYAQARVDTLDSLDELPDLKNAEELKSKLLFSVVVLAFRSASSSAQALREEVRRVLQVPPPPPPSDPHPAYDPHSHALELGVSSFVTANIDKHDLSKNVEEVCQQIWATLYDYPSLKSCEGLLQYIKECVRLAWGLCNQTPPYVIDYETRTYRKESHVRFHTADPEKEMIKTYLWPALLEGHGGPCVQKGVVVT